MRRLFFLLLTSLTIHAHAQQEIFIWPNTTPVTPKVRIAETGDHVISNIQSPSITYYPAANPTGAAIVIAPGGGHVEIWIDHEGYRVAEWFSKHGIAAFVLKYRLAKEPGSKYSVDVESLADMQRALRYVRHHAKEWNIDSSRVGVMGFSAGGELAALTAMRYDNVQLPVHDAVDDHSSKPDFQALIYPGNSDRFTVTKNSPPCFILCGYKDVPGISEGMPKLYLKYKEMGVPAELHILANIGHGFGIRATNTGAVATWPQLVFDWLGDSGLLGAHR